ncbi:MAG: hypothetical protein ABIG63_21620 [Chloroflexota bacterium]
MPPLQRGNGKEANWTLDRGMVVQEMRPPRASDALNYPPPGMDTRRETRLQEANDDGLAQSR